MTSFRVINEIKMKVDAVHLVRCPAHPCERIGRNPYKIVLEYLELVSGTVSINTVVVRPEKTALPQTVRLQEGKLHMIDLGGKRAVSGFRISDNGRGVYRVIIQ